MLWLIILIGLVVAILIYLEYKEHDCIQGKDCNCKTCKTDSSDDPLRSLDKIKKMVKTNYDFVSWRLALLAGIIGALPVIYYIVARTPTFFEWFIVAMLIFAATYLSNS